MQTSPNPLHRVATPGTVLLRHSIATLLTLVLLAACAMAERTVVPFDQNWRFKEAAVEGGAQTPTFDDSTWDRVTTPHAFPPIGTPNHLGAYRGEAWYRKSFDAPAAWAGQRVFLRFDAVAMVSDTYLNGESLGQHRGGFAAFTYELTGKLKLGAANTLALRVDDRWNNEVAPLEQSLLCGGIYRHVSLIVTGPVDITPLDFSSPGIFLTQHDVSANNATVDVRTEISNAKTTAQPVTVRMTLLDANDRKLFANDAAGDAIAAHGNAATATSVTQSITIPRPHLWNGVADPYLYHVRIDLMQSGKIVDSVTQPLGIRFFRIDPEKGFLLNGKAMQIHGACLHQDWGTLGWAVSPAEEKIDLDILRDMGADGLRLVHYQHSPSALDLYDKTGMLIWSELAQFRLVNASEGYRQNVRQQLTEMIRQNYNHPSIVMWSLFNELASKVNAEAEPIVKELNVLAHKEDPTRPTVAAGSGDTIANSHAIMAAQDLIGDNNYAGWYQQAPEEMNNEIVKWNDAYGKRGLAISEYGGGAKISDHKQGLVTGDVKPYGAFQPEEWQALVHEGNYRAIKNHPFVWGSFLWLSFDSGGEPRTDGSIQGGNIKGLITQDRKVKKDAYFLYQANWAAKPMIYITSRRQVERTEATTPVKIYSNEPSVTLTVNGKSYGEQKPDDLHVFHWKKIELNPGANVIEATSPDGQKDTVTWTYVK